MSQHSSPVSYPESLLRTSSPPPWPSVSFRSPKSRTPRVPRRVAQVSRSLHSLAACSLPSSLRRCRVCHHVIIVTNCGCGNYCRILFTLPPRALFVCFFFSIRVTNVVNSAVKCVTFCLSLPLPPPFHFSTSPFTTVLLFTSPLTSVGTLGCCRKMQARWLGVRAVSVTGPLTLRVRGRPFPSAHSTLLTFRFTALRKGNSPSTVAPSPMFLTAVLANLTPSRLPATLLELEVTSCPLRHSHVRYCFACPSQPDL